MLGQLLRELERGPRTIAELAAALDADPSVVAGVLDQLARLGRIQLGSAGACTGRCDGCAALPAAGGAAASCGPLAAPVPATDPGAPASG